MSDDVPSLISKAREALSAGNFTDASFMFHSAARHSREEHLQEELAYSLRHAAQADLELGNHEQALVDSTEALGLYLVKPDAAELNIANTKRLIALALEAKGLTGEAKVHWRAAREIYERAGITDGINECDNHLRQQPDG